MNGGEKALIEIKEDLKELRKGVNRLLNKTNFINWVRMAAILIPIVMAAIGSLAYETGLYKPVPTHIEKLK